MKITKALQKLASAMLDAGVKGPVTLELSAYDLARLAEVENDGGIADGNYLQHHEMRIQLRAKR